MMTPATTASARVGAAAAAFGPRGLKLQVAFVRGATSGTASKHCCPYSSLSILTTARQQCTSMSMTRTTKSITSSTKTPQSTIIARRPAPVQSQFIARRNASTATTPNTNPASSSTSTTADPPLDWNSFFTLRKTRRRFQVFSSLITMSIGGTAGAMLLVNMDMDWLLSKVPMDPFFALGIMTMSFAGLGWLAGPSVGSSLFYVFKRGVKKPMAVKESEFFARIKKNRVDPSNSSLSGNAGKFKSLII